MIPVTYFKSDNDDYTIILNNNEATLKDNIDTSIHPLHSPSADWETNADQGDYYTIGGRKLNGKPTVKGVYINKGRKVIVP